MHAWADDIFAKILEKYDRAIPQAAAQNCIPYKGNTLTWEESPWDGNSWWTGGFWPAACWQLYAATHQERYLTEARRAKGLLTAEFDRFEKLNHDVGFMYLLSCGADWKLTGQEKSRIDCIHAANLLMGRFNPCGFLRAWNGDRIGWSIVDSMMNLSILYWASEAEKDPRYAKVANLHANTCMREFVRPDGSCWHIIGFDPDTGVPVEYPAGQGAYSGSSWSRGQAWGLYGFTLAAKNAKLPAYLDTAKRIAHYFIANIRPDGLTACDFRRPLDEQGADVIDNIAGACAACGLLELAKLVPESEAPLYTQAAMRLLQGLVEHCCDWSADKLGILTLCTAAYNNDGAGRHENIQYGDYFFIEAICKLTGTDPMLWSY